MGQRKTTSVKGIIANRIIENKGLSVPMNMRNDLKVIRKVNKKREKTFGKGGEGLENFIKFGNKLMRKTIPELRNIQSGKTSIMVKSHIRKTKRGRTKVKNHRRKL